MSTDQINSFTFRSSSSCLAFIFATCLLLSCGVSVNAQAPGSSRGVASSDGIHMIQGRILFPPGQQAITGAVKVNLESVSSFGATSTVTDQDGVFRFRNLQAGGYTVVVDAGKEYETARETVSIDREASPGGRTIQIAIQLRFRVDASNPAFANVPPKALDAYQKGLAAAKKGNSKSAAELLSNAVVIHPDFPIALSELGIQYLKLGEMSKLAETMQSLLKLTPNDSRAHLHLGIALFNQKKLPDAESHLREAIRLNGSDPAAHYYLGMTLVSAKQYGEAEKELELAIANGGDTLALAHKYLGGLYLSSNKPQQAVVELEKYLRLDPKAADAERIKGTIKDLRDKH